jgi:hypothetical protein
MFRDHKGIRYTTVVASDLVRDGVGLELHWHFDRQDVVVAEIFASDKDGSWTLSTFGCDIPLEVVEEFVTEAKARLKREPST